MVAWLRCACRADTAIGMRRLRRQSRAARGEQLRRVRAIASFFIRAHHEDARRAIAAVAMSITGRCVLTSRIAIALFVEDGAEKSEALQAAMPHQRAVFADAAGERDRVDAAHDGGVGADVFANAMRVEADGQPAAFIAFAGAPLDVAHVAGAREARQARPLVEQVFERVAA